MQNGSNQINIVLNLKKNQMLTTSDFQHAIFFIDAMISIDTQLIYVDMLKCEVNIQYC